MKRWIKQALMGGLGGIVIAQILALVISWPTGIYYPCSLEMMEAYGELPAVALQMGTSFLLGSVMTLANSIWEMEWSLTRQTLLVYLIDAGSYLAVSWVNYWAIHTWAEVLRILGTFTVIFAGIWVVIWLNIQKNIRSLNQNIQSSQPGREDTQKQN